MSVPIMTRAEYPAVVLADPEGLEYIFDVAMNGARQFCRNHQLIPTGEWTVDLSDPYMPPGGQEPWQTVTFRCTATTGSAPAHR